MTRRFKRTLDLLASLGFDDVAKDAGRPFEKYPYLLEMTMVALATALEEHEYKLHKFEQKAAALQAQFKRVAQDDVFNTSKKPSRDVFARRYELLEQMLRG
mmetsp:Transcript_32434/g.96843  ORF Transcript_32434/g.96843 Transcript_32434/m.96843 type:complete len:101 (-) Transcript_32434:328-630(-)